MNILTVTCTVCYRTMNIRLDKQVFDHIKRKVNHETWWFMWYSCDRCITK